MLPVIRLGPVTLPTAPMVLIAVFFTLQELGDHAARRLKLPEGVVSTALFWTFGVGLGAARLGYVARNLDAYISDPLQILGLNFGTLDLTAGVLFGLVAGVAYLQRKKINMRLFADAMAPALALALAVYSFGNLLTGDAYGTLARDLPWAIELWGEQRHPVQVYEMLAYLAIFALLWFQTRQWNLFDGAPFLVVITLLAAARLMLEPLRGDSVAWVAGLRGAQVVAFVLMTVALVGLVFGLRRSRVPTATLADGTTPP